MGRGQALRGRGLPDGGESRVGRAVRAAGQNRQVEEVGGGECWGGGIDRGELSPQKNFGESQT